MALLLTSQRWLTGFDTAAGLVMHHPELANVQPYYATAIPHDHVAPSPDDNPDQYNAIANLGDEHEPEHCFTV